MLLWIEAEARALNGLEEPLKKKIRLTSLPTFLSLQIAVMGTGRIVSR
jgi:hypothetical protein